MIPTVLPKGTAKLDI